MPAIAVTPKQEHEIGNGTVGPARVLLYNDDWHTFAEVIAQLQKATGCSAEEGERIAWEVHTQGRAVAFQGSRQACENVVKVLREIRLQVELDWDES